MLGWKPDIDLTKLQDDLTCPTTGWSFLKHPSNHLNFAYKSLLRLAWSASFLGKPFEKNSHWLPEACSTYLRSLIELAGDIFAAVHLTAGLPGRGTEIGSVRVSNTMQALRNVFVRNGRIMIIISYNKARASNNHAFYVVRYLPPQPRY
jgi:hypothetical protein